MPGQLIDQRYQILGEFGRGGMGVIYRVKQVFLNKEMLLKTIDKANLSDLTIRRFQQEAKAACSLNHPSIVTVHDFGVLEGHIPYLTMELLHGETLSQRLKRVGALSLDDAFKIFIPVCFGLAYAHENGVVHRDIKPSNIMLRSDLPLDGEGAVKVLDFGIAKLMQHEDGELQSLTRTGEIIGSPLYMSPEQCGGRRTDQRSDVYSLGCVLFEVLTGAPPFIGDSALTTMMKHQTEPASSLTDASLGAKFSPAMESIVSKMLAKDPANRYQNLALAAHDLNEVRRGGSASQAILASLKSSNRGAANSKPSKKSVSGLVLGVISLILLLVAGSFAFLQFNNSSHHESDANAESSSKANVGSASLKEQNESVPTEKAHKALAESAFDFRDIPEAEFQRISTPYKGQVRIVAADIDEIHLRWLCTKKGIEHLILSGCQLDNPYLSSLSSLPVLNFISVHGSTLDGVGAAALAALPHVTNLDVAETQIGDEAAECFAKMKKLETLNLSRTQITDQCLTALSKTNLIELILEQTEITNEGMVKLEKSKLQRISVDDTAIGDSGLAALSKIDSLKGVRLSGTQVTLSGIENFCHASPRAFVFMNGCKNLHPGDVEKLKNEFPSCKFESNLHER